MDLARGRLEVRSTGGFVLETEAEGDHREDDGGRPSGDDRREERGFAQGVADLEHREVGKSECQALEEGVKANQQPPSTPDPPNAIILPSAWDRGMGERGDIAIDGDPLSGDRLAFP